MTPDERMTSNRQTYSATAQEWLRAALQHLANRDYEKARVCAETATRHLRIAETGQIPADFQIF